jgi:hypothetical protein
VSSLAGKICAYLFILGRRDGLNVLVPLSLERLTFVLLRSRFIGCRICLEIICRIRSSVYLALFTSWLGWRSALSYSPARIVEREGTMTKICIYHSAEPVPSKHAP